MATLKHVVIEYPRPGCIEKLEEAGVALQKVLIARGMRTYRAFRAVDGERDEPGHYDVGLLGRASAARDTIAVFECEFPDRATLEAQLKAIRNDPEAVKIMVRAAELVHTERTTSFIVQSWNPPLS